MIEMLRQCPDCRSDQPFELYYQDFGGCPDCPDGDCSEWGCTACGAVLLIGFTMFAAESATAAGLRDMVA